MFASAGLPYNPPPDVIPSTLLALRVSELARDRGLHDALHELITLRQLSYGWRRTDATEQESRQPEPPRARKTAILRRHSGP